MFFFNSRLLLIFYNNNNNNLIWSQSLSLRNIYILKELCVLIILLLKNDLNLSLRWLTITRHITNLHAKVQVTTLTSGWNVVLSYLWTWSLHFFKKNLVFKIGASHLILINLSYFLKLKSINFCQNIKYNGSAYLNRTMICSG